MSQVASSAGDGSSLNQDRTDKYGITAYMTPHNSVWEDIDQVARTGGHGIGLSELKLAEGEDERVLEAMHKAGLRALNCVPSSHTLLGMSFGPFAGAELTLSQRIDMICESVIRLAAFDPVSIVVAPGASGDPNRRLGPVDSVVEALPIIADVAAEYGQRIGFELLGERRGSPLFTIPDMVAVMDAVDRPNVGIVFDVFHSWPEPHLHEHIRQYIDRIDAVQVCDVKVHERSGMDREFPGRGRAVATEIMATFIEAGYQGWWELEVFSDDGTYFEKFPDSYWTMPHEEFLGLGRNEFDRCYLKAAQSVRDRRG